MPREVLRLEDGSNVLVHVGCKQKYRLGFTSPSETEILPSLRDMPPAGDVNLNYREIGGGELAMELVLVSHPQILYLMQIPIKNQK